MDQNKKTTFQKLDSLVEKTRQIIQDTMILFEHVENSAQLVNEMKKNITKWTNSHQHPTTKSKSSARATKL